jgi:DnaJ-class molecular chaperone
MDEIARAYATLGVPAGTPLAGVRKQYKALVRKWHPDRFASDPQGQAEATTRMRAINDAFRLVAERSIRDAVPQSHARAAGPDQPSAAPRGEPQFGRRLTREEIDRMVEAMKNDGPLDWILDGFPPAEEGLGRKMRAGALALAVAVVPALFAQAFRGLPVGVVLWGIILTTVAAFAFFLRVLPKS